MTNDQLTDTDLAGMTPHEIVEARAAGRLDRVLGVPEPDIEVRARARAGGVLDRADCTRLNQMGEAALVHRAATEGRVTDRHTTKEN